MSFSFWLSLLLQVSTNAQAPPPAVQGPQPGVIVQETNSRTATIRGKITNANTGSAVQDAQITLRPSGRGEVAASATADTNGNYEIRVAPGLYNMSVARDGFVLTHYQDVANVPVLELRAGQEAAVTLRMLPGATMTGLVTDVDGAPIANVNVLASVKVYRQGKVELQLRASARTNERGEYRLSNLVPGRYYLQAGIWKPLQAGKQGPADTGTRAFLPMIYPGASRIEDAQAIRVNAGEEKTAINFRLRNGTTSSVSGRITFLATGQPVANMTIHAYPEFPGFGISASTQSRADGTFRLDGLTAGRYRMEGELIGDFEGGPRGHFLQFFEVTAADITGLTIHVGTGTTVKGKLRAVGGSLPERMRVQPFLRKPLAESGYVHALEGAIPAADGAFEIKGVQPGTYDLKISNSPARAGPVREFFIGAVTVAGQDVADGGVRVPEGTAVMEVSVTVDLQPGTVIGKTLDSENRPIPGANLALMGADPKRRLLDVYWRQIKSDREGSFRLGSLIPGDYLLIMWPGDRAWDVLGPETFAILEKNAVRVTVERSSVISRNPRLTKEMRTLLDGLSP